mgnify:CR=1 FL=1
MVSALFAGCATTGNFEKRMEEFGKHRNFGRPDFNKMKDMMIIDTSTKTIDQVVKIIQEAI